MIVKLLTKHHLECLSLTGSCRGSSESTLVKMSNCWKSHAPAHLIHQKHGHQGEWPDVIMYGKTLKFFSSETSVRIDYNLAEMVTR